MCNCSKILTQTDCQRLREFFYDPQKRLFIYHIFDGEKGLQIRYVPNDKTPNEIAELNNFFNENGNLEWFHISEHPCLYE